MNINIYAHVGLPKTGTSFLQKNFFSKITASFFSTYPPFKWVNDFFWIYDINKEWVKDLYQNKKLLTRASRDASLVKYINKNSLKWDAKAEQCNLKANELTVISAEGLTGLSSLSAKCMAKLLLHSGVNKLIFVYRQQATWSYSLWSQMVLKEDRFARFISYQDMFGVEPNPNLNAVVDMDWAMLLEMYQDVFGNENVLALPYELLLLSPENFYQKIQKFMLLGQMDLNVTSEIENPSLKTTTYIGWRVDSNNVLLKMPSIRLRLHYHLTPYIKKSLILSRLFLKEVVVEPISEELKQKIMQNFEVQNRKLAKMSGFKLEDFWYY
jgi:hypothetical protein